MCENSQIDRNNQPEKTLITQDKKMDEKLYINKSDCIEEEYGWYKFDIHHHTHQDNIINHSRRNVGLKNVEEILKNFNNDNGRLLAITDHNQISIEAIKEYKIIIKNQKYKIYIIPGVELDLCLSSRIKKHKIQVLVLFNINEINKLEKVNKIIKDKYIKSDKTLDTLYEMLEKIYKEVVKQWINIIVIPHGSKENGISSIENNNSDSESQEYWDKKNKYIWNILMMGRFFSVETKLFNKKNIMTNLKKLLKIYHDFLEMMLNILIMKGKKWRMLCMLWG